MLFYLHIIKRIIFSNLINQALLKWLNDKLQIKTLNHNLMRKKYMNYNDNGLIKRLQTMNI